MTTVKRTVVALVEDKPGVLSRITSLFRRRGFNIASIVVGRTEVPPYSRITLVVEGAISAVDQVAKQLRKLVSVARVVDVTDEDLVSRELSLIKVRATGSTRSEIIQIVDIFRASIVDVSPDSLIIEVTGDEDKVDSLATLLKPFGIKEIARTGRIVMQRSKTATIQERGLSD